MGGIIIIGSYLCPYPIVGRLFDPCINCEVFVKIVNDLQECRIIAVYLSQIIESLAHFKAGTDSTIPVAAPESGAITHTHMDTQFLVDSVQFGFLVDSVQFGRIILTFLGEGKVVWHDCPFLGKGKDNYR
jgi:hypothetical protein